MTLFTLADLRKAITSCRPITRAQALAAKVPAANGCSHLCGNEWRESDGRAGLSQYALSNNSELRLSLAVVVGRRVVLLRWALGPIAKPGPDLPNYLTQLAEITLAEVLLQAFLPWLELCVVGAAVAVAVRGGAERGAAGGGGDGGRPLPLHLCHRHLHTRPPPPAGEGLPESALLLQPNGANVQFRVSSKASWPPTKMRSLKLSSTTKVKLPSFLP